MSADTPPPDPLPGEHWYGGANGGHIPATVQVLQVSKTRVRVRFRTGRDYGRITWLYRYQFAVQFRPA